MVLNLKVFSANYKLHTTNYNVRGVLHDGKNLRATAPPLSLEIDQRDAGTAAFYVVELVFLDERLVV